MILAIPDGGRGISMADGKPPIIGTALRAWADTWRAVAAMPLTTAVGLACVLAARYAGQVALQKLLPPPGSPLYDSAEDGLPANLMLSAFGILAAVLVAPFFIALHRHVLLKQVTHGYPISPQNARFLRYALFATLFYVLQALPVLGTRLVDTAAPDLSLAVSLLVTALIKLVVAVVVVQHALLYPAIAVDAERVDWKRARLLTKGHSWRVFFTLVCAMLPFLILVIPMHYFWVWGITGGETGLMIYWLEAPVAEFAALAVLAATASLIYQALDPTLGAAPKPAATIVAR